MNARSLARLLVRLLAGALLAPSLWAATSVDLTLEAGGPVYRRDARPELAGTSTAPAGTLIHLRVVGRDGATSMATATVSADGTFRALWPEDLESDFYRVEAWLESAPEHLVTVELRVQRQGELPRRPLVAPETPAGASWLLPDSDDLYAVTDRWRLPLAEGANGSKGKWDPYHQNKWKGDFPIHGEDRFLVLTASSDTLVDAFEVPTPSSASADRPGSFDFFGQGDAVLLQELIVLTADYYKGSTVFEPFAWRLRASVALNGNYLDVRENGAVNPDVRNGTDRDDGFLALQELFFEKRLAVISPNYDFMSLRVGIQPFNSDFRGFVFTDTNLGVRFFGNAESNRWQYNLAYFERLEKDTNSGLNTFEFRDQQVLVANVYRQDLRLGYTGQASVHYLRDEASFLLDENGFLARPDPVGAAQPHDIEAFYLGFAGLGHFGRWNVDHALYYVAGTDSLNPIAGPDIFAPPSPSRDEVDISAGMAALEVSYDKDWFRPKFTVFYSTGDSDPLDRDAEGWAPIFDQANFAGGGFSFWNRLGIRLAGTGVSLVNRGTFVPDLRSSKEEGQPNFVNPGLLLLGLGLDVEVTPKLKLVATANHLDFDATEVLELLLFQETVDKEIGWDLSLGARWRPFLNNNMVVTGGVATFLPGDGFEDIYEDDGALFGLFTNLRLVF
jgi:hypothetical protein